MLSLTDVQYISDAEGKHIGVIVPIDLWREIVRNYEATSASGCRAQRRHIA
jgi:hypothetical protein